MYRFLLRSSFYATTCGAVFLACAPASAAPPKEIILYSLSGPDGAHPLGGVIVSQFGSGTAPLLLGTTYSGGTTGNGTIFSIQNGAFTTLHAFTKKEGTFPQSGLTQGPDNKLSG